MHQATLLDASESTQLPESGVSPQMGNTVNTGALLLLLLPPT